MIEKEKSDQKRAQDVAEVIKKEKERLQILSSQGMRHKRKQVDTDISASEEEDNNESFNNANATQNLLQKQQFLDIDGNVMGNFNDL